MWRHHECLCIFFPFAVYKVSGIPASMHDELEPECSHGLWWLCQVAEGDGHWGLGSLGCPVSGIGGKPWHLVQGHAGTGFSSLSFTELSHSASSIADSRSLFAPSSLSISGLWVPMIVVTTCCKEKSLLSLHICGVLHWILVICHITVPPLCTLGSLSDPGSCSFP